MLTALALAAALGGAPAQPDLKLTNVRMTVGELGPTRASSKVLPGDVLFVAYDIEGITIDEEGNAAYTMAMEVTNPAGRAILKQEPSDRRDFAPLRGNRLPGRAFVTVGLDEAPGQFTCKLTVADPKTKLKADLTVKFEVLKKEFAVVAVYPSYDEKGELSAPTSGQVGQMLFVHYTVAAFERDPKTKEPNVEIQYQLYDDKGKAILVNAKGEPVPRKHIQDGKAFPPVKPEDGAFTRYFPLFLNRAGKFTFEITAKDMVTGKSFVYKLPVTATAPN
jgi:hypothetical protein